MSQTQALEIPTLHIDGAFQTASGLFRLSNGELPGRDFFPYLGIGPIFLLFPAFLASGSDMYASIFSAQLFTYLAGATAVFFTTLTIVYPNRPLSALLAAAIIFSTILAYHENWPGSTVLDLMANPGMSIRMIRAGVPYIFGILSILVLMPSFNAKTRYGLLGIVVGLSVVWSNDFAYTTFLSFSLCIAAICVRSMGLKSISHLGLFILAALSTGAFALTLATAGQPINYLDYGFGDVAHDQWWYFGPYETTSRVFRFGDIRKLYTSDLGLALAVLAIAFSLWVRTGAERHLLSFGVGLATLGSGVLASVGGHIWGYLDTFKLWALLTFLSYALVGFRLAVFRTGLRPSQSINLTVSILIAFAFAALLNRELDQNTTRRLELASNADMTYIQELGGYLPREWGDYVDFAKEHSNEPIVEEYWGIFSALNTATPIWPVDSVIHALGETRGVAQSRISDANFVVTSRFDFSPTWQPWSVSQNFWLYEQLFYDWEPFLYSPNTIVWRRLNIPQVRQPVNCSVLEGGIAYDLSAGEDGFFSVLISYELANPRQDRILIMVRNNISFASAARGFVSIDPKGNLARFPIIKHGNSDQVFDIKVIGSDTATAVISSCNAKRIPNASPEFLGRGSPHTFYLTNDNWVHGVARHWAGFFLPDLDQYVNLFKPGRVVKFGDGELRRILRVAVSAGYLNVYVEGAPLAPESVGVPSGFTILPEQ